MPKGIIDGIEIDVPQGLAALRTGKAMLEGSE